MTRHLTLERFLDLIADMPDVEAMEEIEARRACLAEELGHVEAERVRFDRKSERGEVLQAKKMTLQADLTELNFERKRVNDRMNSSGWKQGVRELFGEDGLERLLIWMEERRVPIHAARSGSK